MIFPFFNGIQGLSKAPITWFLILINGIFLMVTYPEAWRIENKMVEPLRKGEFLLNQGRIYQGFVIDHPESYSTFVRQTAQKTKSTDKQALHLLGQLALKDSFFLSKVSKIERYPDEVALASWKKNVQRVTEYQAIHPHTALGLNQKNQEPIRWLTYQFVHSDFLHYFGNMLFLLIFGSALEPLIGGLFFLFIYLGSGVVGAGVFLFLSGASVASLVGASGAVMGVAACCSVLLWKQPVRYIFWLFIPSRGYAGYVFLPGWIALVLSVVGDLAGYLGQWSELGGVAYSAHLGGMAFGAVVGLICYASKKNLKISKTLDVYPVGTKVV